MMISLEIHARSSVVSTLLFTRFFKRYVISCVKNGTQGGHTGKAHMKTKSAKVRVT